MIAPYKNPKVPYLQLVDSSGIQLDRALSINNIGDNAATFIREKLAQKILMILYIVFGIALIINIL